MPRYDFKDIATKISLKSKPKSDISIKLDDEDYLGKSINTNFIKKIQFSCPSGSITIQGLFDLSKANIEELISFKYLTIEFSEELKFAYKQEFDNPNISIKFKLLPENEEIIRNNINILKKKFKDFDTDYNSFIKFNLEEFTDLNILEILNKIENEEKNQFKFEFGYEEINNKKRNFIDINDIDDNIDDEEINNQSKVFNFFPLPSNDKEKENEEEKEIKDESIIKKNNYIRVQDIDNLKLDNKKVKIPNKFLKKYLPGDKNKLKEEISKDYLTSKNFKNSLFTIDTNEDKFEIKSLFINDELKQLNEKYKKDIILDFLNILIKHHTDSKNAMAINDYTSIVLSLIKNLEKKISEINNNLKDKEYLYYIQRLEKILSSLKLFHILFLNCFYVSSENKDNNNLYDNFSSPKVQTMRKKLLIEWCINEENNYIKKNDLIDVNKNKRKEILTRQIMSFGQIKTAIKTNHNNNLFINTKLSNLSQKTINKTLSYFIKKQIGSNEINKTFISYKANGGDSDKIKNSWISFLLQSLLYKEKSNEYIIKSINLIEGKIQDMEESSKPLIKGVFQLNFVLLKLYELLIKGNKDIKNIEEFINMLSNNNVFGRNNSDHFFQYIISYLLTKIIHNIIPDIENYDLLYQKNYFLLNQIISEILSIYGNDDYNEEGLIENLIIIIKLLHISSINKKSKEKIFIDLISHQNLNSIDSFWKKYDKENVKLINDLNKEYINGIYYLNKNDLLLAYKGFLNSKKYKYALDVYLKYFFSLIKEKGINEINFQEIFDNLNNIYKKQASLFNDFYRDFYSFISYKVNKDNIDYKDIINLLKKFMYQYSGKDKVIYLDENSHRFIIKVLCDILIEKKFENEKLILCGDLKLNELNNVLIDERNYLFNNALNDLIEHKNNQFSS